MTAKNKSETVKTEENQLRDYELVLIVNPDAGEEALEATINGIKEFVGGKGGNVSDEERWGKRKLAYPIKRFMEGNYVLTRFKMDPAWGRELEANLRISEDVLRHLLINTSS